VVVSADGPGRLARRAFLAAAAMSVPAVAGCTGDGDGGDGGNGDTADGNASGLFNRTMDRDEGVVGSTETTSVEMVDTSFDPLKASVEVGATVEWSNQDSTAHTITAAAFHDAAASWDLDTEVAGGESATHTFESEGVYEYYCTIHGEETMCGAILAGEATLDDPLPCEQTGE